jgi:hypothetical protein
MPRARCREASLGSRVAPERARNRTGTGRRPHAADAPGPGCPQAFWGGLPVLFLIFGSGGRGSGLLAKRRFTRSLKSSGVTACALPVVNSRAMSVSLRFVAQSTGLRGGSTVLCAFSDQSTTANSWIGRQGTGICWRLDVVSCLRDRLTPPDA